MKTEKELFKWNSKIKISILIIFSITVIIGIIFMQQRIKSKSNNKPPNESVLLENNGEENNTMTEEIQQKDVMENVEKEKSKIDENKKNITTKEENTTNKEVSSANKKQIEKQDIIQKVEEKHQNESKQEKQNNNTTIVQSEKDKVISKGNETLANTHFTKYNLEKTAHVVSYINSKIKQKDNYKELGGEAIAVTKKPCKNWFSYSYDEKLDSLSITGCTTQVFIEDEYAYDSQGINYYLYDTKAYIYQY